MALVDANMEFIAINMDATVMEAYSHIQILEKPSLGEHYNFLRISLFHRQTTWALFHMLSLGMRLFPCSIIL